MNSIELFLLDIGFSWTLGKAIPYVSMILLGFLFIYILQKRIRSLNVFVRYGIKLIVLVIPFVLYFINSPIYIGDFSNNSIELTKDSAARELEGRRLVVLSIPGCPHCYESIDRMVKLKERVPSMIIEYVVCSSDTMSIALYQEKGKAAITVRLAEDMDAMAQLASGHFPAFVLVNNESPLTKWSNDSFGVLAMDNVEEFFKK